MDKQQWNVSSFASNLNGSIYIGYAVGPCGVYFNFQLEGKQLYIEILGCGKVIFIKNKKKIRLVSGSNYIDRLQLDNLSIYSKVIESEYSIDLNALHIRFEDDSTLHFGQVHIDDVFYKTSISLRDNHGSEFAPSIHSIWF